VCFASADGTLLFYPVPDTDGQPVLPVEGPRLPLTATMHGYEVADPAGGHVWRFLRPGDEVRAGSWPLTTIGDRNGNRIDLDYDETGVLTGVRHSGGYHLRVVTVGTRITALSLGEQELVGGVRRIDITNFDVPSARTGPDGARVEFQYDSELRLTAAINPQGLAWRYEYDAAGALVAETDFDGRTIRYGYRRGREPDQCVLAGVPIGRGSRGRCCPG
jgi:YD repeat-containing protein